MPTTRAELTEYLLQDILGLQVEDEPQQWALHNGIQTPVTLIRAIQTPDILTSAFDFYDDNGDGPNGDGTITTKTMKPGHQLELIDLAKWMISVKASVNGDYTMKSQADFEAYRESLIDDSGQGNAGTPTSIGASPTAFFASPTHGASTSKKEIQYSKRELSAYKDIAQRYNYYDWIKKVKITAKTQGLKNPFDANFVPSNDVEQEQFEVDNAFVYEIAQSKVKYASGRKIVMCHADNQDGRAEFQQLEKDAGGTVVRATSIKVLENKLRDMSAAPSAWSKSLEAFLDAWLQMKLQLESTMDKPVDDDKALDWLQESLVLNDKARAAIDSARLLQITDERTKTRDGDTFVPWTIDEWIEHFRISFQTADDANRILRNAESGANRKQKTNKGKSKERKAKAGDVQHGTGNNGNGNDNDKRKKYEEWKEKCKKVGLWIEPDVWKTWSKEKRADHNAKVHAKVKAYEANNTTTTNNRSTHQSVTSQNRNTNNADATHESTPPPSYSTVVQQNTQPTGVTQPMVHGAGSMQAALSTSHAQRANSGAVTPITSNRSSMPEVVNIGGQCYRVCRYGNIQYNVKNYEAAHNMAMDLVDSGCNGGMAGENALILNVAENRSVDITGIENNVIKGIPIVQAAELFQSDKGPIILIMNEYAGHGKGQTIHSAVQLRDFGVLLDDVPKNQRRFDGRMGTQCMKIQHEGETFTLNFVIERGLAHIANGSKPTLEQMEDESIPKVHITSHEWDPDKYTDSYYNESSEDISVHTVTSNSMELFPN